MPTTTKKGSKPPAGSNNDLLDALKEFEGQRAGRKKKERRQAKMANVFLWLAQGPAWIKAALLVAVVVVVALVADGIRRESAEFSATMAEFKGQVSVLPGGQGSGRTPTTNMALGNEDVVRTGADGNATLIFPDGSSIQLEPNTEFQVRLLDYARGGQRDRSFMVRFGSAVAHVSQYFGAKEGSQATICTPTAVAAVRGTGFRVVYEPQTRSTSVQVVEGTVAVRTAAVQTPMPTTQGQSLSTAGYAVQGVRSLSGARQQGLTTQVGGLTSRYEKAPGILDRVEGAVNGFFDPALQILGLSPGSWSYSTNNFARKTECREALRRLQIHLEEAGGGEGVPEMLNPVTIEELQQDPREVKKIMMAFHGGMIESYEKLGKDQYRVRARARNRNHTLYELDNAGNREVKE